MQTVYKELDEKEMLAILPVMDFVNMVYTFKQVHVIVTIFVKVHLPLKAIIKNLFVCDYTTRAHIH